MPDANEEELLHIRPRVRHDVLYAQTKQGVYLHHSDAQFALKGTATYRLVSSVLPLLDGRRTVAELCDGLSAANRTAVVRLLRALLDRGFVRDLADEPRPRLPRHLLDAHAPLVNYVEHHADDAANRFADFLDTRVLVLGDSPVGRAVAASLERSGLERERVEVRDPADLDRLGDSDLHAVDVAVVADGGASVLGRLVARADTVGGPTVLPMTVVGRQAVLGPLLRPGASPCWTCARLRLGANLSPELAADMWRESALPDLPAAAVPIGAVEEPLGRMIGNALAFDVFRLRTGAPPPETDHAVVLQDLDTLETVRDVVLRHPACPRCRTHPLPPVRPSTVAEDATEEERRHARQRPLFGQHAGVFRGYADADLAQAPLRVGRVRLGAPLRLGGGTRDITAFDLYTTLGARVRAFSAAALGYVEAVRSGGTIPATAEPTAATVAPESLATWAGLPADRGTGPWLPATSLVTGDDRSVPAAAVHPYSGLNGAMLFDRTAAGTGCGATLDEARLAGLLSAHAHRGLVAAASGRLPLGTIASTEVEGDDATAFLLRALGRFPGETALFDLPAADPAHAVLARHAGTGTWTTGSGLSRGAAALAALRDLLGLLQLGEDGADLGDPLLPDLDPLAVARAPAEERPEVTEEKLVAAVGADGHDAVLVETTPPDLYGAGFRTVRVLFVA